MPRVESFPYIPVLVPSSSSSSYGMAGEYIKELNSIFYGFLLKLTLSEKKNAVCIFLQAHEATSTEDERKK